MPIKFAYYERYSQEIRVLNDLRIILATVLLLIVGRIPKGLGIEHELQVLPNQQNSGPKARIAIIP